MAKVREIIAHIEADGWYIIMVELQLPAGFVRPGEDAENLYDSEVHAVTFGWVDGYRVVYSQLPHNWAAYSPDLPGVITTGKTLEKTERNMHEALPFHLEGLAEDRRERPWLYEEQPR